MTILPFGTILSLRSGTAFDYTNMVGEWQCIAVGVKTAIGPIDLWERVA